MPAVPRCCEKKSKKRIGRVSGITTGVAIRVVTLRPSTAERTEIAGVITPSPQRSAAPRIPSAVASARGLGDIFSFSSDPNPIEATIPPFSNKLKQYYLQIVAFWSLKNATSIADIETSAISSVTIYKKGDHSVLLGIQLSGAGEFLSQPHFRSGRKSTLRRKNGKICKSLAHRVNKV